ncbi:MAG: TniQ family protein, partial [Fimbriimonadaceae bacterium]|nr:TniQ family protein [Fimbriimonadaceae bacterium]
RRTYGTLGSADEVIRSHTLLPFYFPYRSDADERNAVASVRAGGIGGLKARLGILASRLGAAHPLKACPTCMDADLSRHQVAYWHVEHQWPSSWICLWHDKPLLRALAKTNGEGRFHWYLPSEVKLVSPIRPDWFEVARPTLRELAQCGAGLATVPSGFHLLPDLLVATYMRRLVELGLASPSGRVRTSDFAALLLQTLGSLNHVYGLSELNGSTQKVLGEFLPLVRRCRGGSHPVKHFVLLVSLFGDWASFLSAYESQHQPHPPEAAAHSPTRIMFPLTNTEDDRKLALVMAIRSGASATTAAARFKVAVATAMAWAAESGIQTPRRPKKLLPMVRTRAIRLLRAGASKKVVADAVGASVQTITLLLRTEPGVRRSWVLAQFHCAQRDARRSWTATARKLAKPTPQTLRHLQPAAFAWLYRNDRAWLESFAATLPARVRSNNSRVQWDERDRDLAQAVRMAGLCLREAEPTTRPRLSHLCNAVPELKARLSKLDRLPLTRGAISLVIRHRSAP